MARIPGVDPRAIVVLGYLDHRQGLRATTKWPRVAFAIGDGTLLLTSAHCVADFHASSGQVLSTDIVVISPYYGDVFDFDIVAIDKQADVAVLKAPWPTHPALALATEQELLAARDLLIAGRPQAGEISGDLRTERLPVSEMDEAVPSRAVRLKGARQIALGWSGSALLIPETGKVAGVLNQLQKGSVRRALFFRSAPSTALGCSIRPVYSLLRAHGLEGAALGRPANVMSIPDSEHAFSAAIRCFQALFERDRGKLVDGAGELTRLRPRSLQAHLLAAIAAIVSPEGSATPSEEQFDLAESSYKRALDLDPNHAHARAVYGDFLIARGRNAEARVQNEAALAVDPNNRLALFNRLVLLPIAQRREAAERLIAMEPNDPLCWFYYSGALLRLGQTPEALRAAQKAVDLEPEGRFHGALADVLVALDRYDEAERHYVLMTERCGCRHCWFRHAHFLLAHREGQFQEAERALNEAELKAPHGQVTQKSLDALRLQLLEKTSPDRAATLARRLLETEPNDATHWWRLAGILRTLGKHDDAVAAARRAVDLQPNGSFGPRLANCLAQAGRIDEAQSTYDEMLRLHPDRPRYWYWYAQFLREHRPTRTDEARAALVKAETVSGEGGSVSADEIRELRQGLDAMRSPVP